MFDYPIYSVADEQIFEKQCAALEKHIPNLIKVKLLIDVEGSKIQIYEYLGHEIRVHNNYFTNEVNVVSEIELEQFFN